VDAKPNPKSAKDRPTLLMIGDGEPMDAALRVALDRNGFRVLESPTTSALMSVRKSAPDLVLLVGDAARDGGRALLRSFSRDATASVVPVVVLSGEEGLDTRVMAFRHGAIAAVPRTASADEIARRVASLARELEERGESCAELGEATFDELVDFISRELRSGILSVGRQGAQPMRIVLGAGRPVAEAVQEFVQRLQPLVARAEPLVYEFHQDLGGGAIGLLEAESGAGDLSIFQGLRVLLVDDEPARADALAQELRSRGATVAVTDTAGRGVDRASGLDPEVVVLDAAGIEGQGFDVVRQIRRDVRLRWASILVAPWDELWPDPKGAPDLARLAQRIVPLVVHDRELRERASEGDAFDVRLEGTGPCRLLRVLASLRGPYHVSVRSAKAALEIDVAEGLVVGAVGTRPGGPPLEGTRALAALLAMGSARVHVERRANPAIANVMAPVEEALARAVQEPSPITPSAPPSSDGGGDARGGRRAFPSETRIARRGGARVDESATDLPSLAIEPPAIPVSTSASFEASDDLSWGEAPKPIPAASGAAAAGGSAAGRSAAGAAAAGGSAAAPRPEARALGPSKDGPETGGSRALPRGVFFGPSAAHTPGVGGAGPTRPPVRPKTLLRGVVRGTPWEVPPAGASKVGPAAVVRAPASAATTVIPAGASQDTPAPPAETALDTLPDVGVGERDESASGRPSSPIARIAPKKVQVRGGLVELDARRTSDVRAAGELPRSDVDRPSLRELSASDGLAAPEGPAASEGVAVGGARAREGAAVSRHRFGQPEVGARAREGAAIEPRVEVDGESPGPAPAESAGESDAAAPSAARSPGAQASALDVVAPPQPSLPRESPPSADAPAAAPAAARAPAAVRERVAARGGGASRALAYLLLILAVLTVTGVVAVIAARKAGLEIAEVGALFASTERAAAVGGATVPAPNPSDEDERAREIESPDEGEDTENGEAGFELVEAGVEAGGTGGGSTIAPEFAGATEAPAIERQSAGATEAPAIERQSAGATEAPAATDPHGDGRDAVGSTGTTGPIVTGSGTPVGLLPERGGQGAAAPTGAGADLGEGAAERASGLEAEEEGASAVDAYLERARTAPPAIAENLYRRALALDPQNHYAMIGLARLLVARGAAADAVPLAEAAVRRRPRRAAYRVLLGDVRQAAGDSTGAREAWEQALDLEPDNREARARLGR
jgi:DNA-binding response OmpR family regulator